MKMRLGVMAASLFACTAAFASNHAKIRYEGQVMEVIGDDRVRGSLRDLESYGAGEEEEIVDACFEGSKDDVCELLAVGVKELNDKEHRHGSDKFELDRCKLNDYGGLVIAIVAHHEAVSIPVMPACR